MRPLILNEKTKEEIQRVRNYAENNPLTLSKRQSILDGTGEIPGDNPNFVCVVPKDYRCVFTIDQGKKENELFWVRHLSVSVPDPSMCPNILGVQILMKEFGFRQNLCDAEGKLRPSAEVDLYIWLENQDVPDAPKAFNVVEPYDETI